MYKYILSCTVQKWTMDPSAWALGILASVSTLVLPA